MPTYTGASISSYSSRHSNTLYLQDIRTLCIFKTFETTDSCYNIDAEKQSYSSDQNISRSYGDRNFCCSHDLEQLDLSRPEFNRVF